MSGVNLLPPEIRAQRLDAARAHRVRRVGILGLAGLVLLYGFWTFQVIMGDRELARLEARRAEVASAVRALDDVAAGRDALLVARGREASLMLGEVSWSGQLIQISRVVPAGFVFTSLSGQSTPGLTTGTVGTITFSAVARRLGPTQMLLVRLRTQEGWSDGWVSSISGDGTDFDVSGSVSITADALTDRGAGGA